MWAFALKGRCLGHLQCENNSAVILAYHASMSSIWNSSMMKSAGFNLKEHCSQAGLCNAKSELGLWRDSSCRWRGPLCCCGHSAAVTRCGRCKLLALQYCPESGTLVLLERLTCKPVQDCMFCEEPLGHQSTAQARYWWCRRGGGLCGEVPTGIFEGRCQARRVGAARAGTI